MKSGYGFKTFELEKVTRIITAPMLKNSYFNKSNCTLLFKN
jgi:hypothetical protein